MISLNTGGRCIDLPQLYVPDFVDSLWKHLPVWRSGWKVGWGRGGEGRRRGGRDKFGWNVK